MTEADALPQTTGSRTSRCGANELPKPPNTSLRENLASVLDQVVDRQETIIVRRRKSGDVAFIPANDLAGLIETAHLLRSPRNARHLPGALHRAERVKGSPPRRRSCGERSSVKPEPERRTVFSREFREDIPCWVLSGRSTAIRILDLVDAIVRDPFTGPASPSLCATCWQDAGQGALPGNIGWYIV